MGYTRILSSWLTSHSTPLRYLFSLGILLTALSRNTPASAPQWPHQLTLDYCRFKGEDGQVYLEVYLDLPRSLLTYAPTSEGWEAILRFLIELRSGESLILRDGWFTTDIVQDTAQLTTQQRIVEGRVFLLSPGNYLLSARVEDTLSHRSLEQHIPVKIEPFPQERLTLSDIELASKLLPPGGYPQFDRGEFTLIPSPRRLFSDEAPYFYYYVEVYPPLWTPPQGTFTLSRLVLNSKGDTVIAYPKVSFKGEGKSFADVDSLHFGQLSGGSYQFLIGVEMESGEQVVQRKRFFLLSDVKGGAPAPEVDSLSVELELAHISFLIPSREMERLKRAPIGEKVRFLNQFWSRYDDDPSTPEVPARELFSLRVEEADRRFTTSRLPGHKTDRGRIYILYGEPDERETHPFDVEAKPYEIWRYNQTEGGLIFVFVDRSGMGEYLLVHSNKRGEIYNPQWYEDFVNRSGIETRR